MTDRYKYRLKFKKYAKMRFIGHLDLLNLFHKAIKRAELKIAYSGGFNPHQETVFALPLKLGHAGHGEFLDIIMTEVMDGEEIKQRLNAKMLAGLEIINARMLAPGEKSSASIVGAASYKVDFPPDANLTTEKTEAFINQNEITAVKKTKSSEKEIDIKPFILKFTPEYENGIVKSLNLLLNAGPEKSLNPDLVVKAMTDFSKAEISPYSISYTRQGLLKVQDGVFEEII